MDPAYRQIMMQQGADARRERMDEEMKRMFMQDMLRRIMGGGMPMQSQGAGMPPEQYTFQPDGGQNSMLDMLRAYITSGQGR